MVAEVYSNIIFSNSSCVTVARQEYCSLKKKDLDKVYDVLPTEKRDA